MFTLNNTLKNVEEK